MFFAFFGKRLSVGKVDAPSNDTPTGALDGQLTPGEPNTAASDPTQVGPGELAESNTEHVVTEPPLPQDMSLTLADGAGVEGDGAT